MAWSIFKKKQSTPQLSNPSTPSSSTSATGPLQPTVGASPQGQPSLQKRAKNIIAIASAKGGVGKSTLTANLATSLSFYGFRVGVLDADIYGPSQPSLLGQKNSEPVLGGRSGAFKPLERQGVQFMSMGLLIPSDSQVVWRAPMATKALTQMIQEADWGLLDFLLIDLPPGTGDIPLSIAQQIPLTGAVLVTTPQELAVGITRRGMQLFKSVNVPVLGIVENMSGYHCDHCGKETSLFKSGLGKALAEESQVPFLGAIPLSSELVKWADQGQSIVAQQPDHDISKNFLAVALALQTQLKRVEESIETESSGEEPKEVHVLDQAQLQLLWHDDTETRWNVRDLRFACRCASCVEEMTGKQILEQASIPSDLKLLGFGTVGRYALTFRFSDGHSTGIYNYNRLRKGTQTSASVMPTPNTQSSGAPANASQLIQQFLDEKVNPTVAGHGGAIRLIKFENGIAYLSMQGGCQGCSAAQLTLNQGVEKHLKVAFSWVTKVIDTTDHSAGTQPYLP